MHLHPAPPCGRPPERRAALRAVEPDAERAHHPAVRRLPAQRAQHLQPGQRGRLRHVQEVEGLQGKGQGVREHHQVSCGKQTQCFTEGEIDGFGYIFARSQETSAGLDERGGKGPGGRAHHHGGVLHEAQEEPGAVLGPPRQHRDRRLLRRRRLLRHAGRRRRG